MLRTILSKARKPAALLMALALTVGIISSPGLTDSPFSGSSVINAEAAELKIFSGAVDTAVYLREQLKTNVDRITINVKNIFDFKEDKIFKFGDLVFNHLAKGYTGKADEGDILFPRQYTSLSYSYDTKDDYVTFSFKVTRNITASQQTEVDKAVAAIKKELKLTSLPSDYHRILAVHDWLVKNVKYDNSLQKHTVYDALVGKKSVCDGYALATYLLLNDLGIPCRFMSGTGNGDSHAWNIVYLEGKWYYVDTTWDANAYEQGVPEKSHKYFLKCWKNFPDHSVGEQTITDWNDLTYEYATSDFTGTKGSSAGFMYPVMTASGFRHDISCASASLSYYSYGYDGNAKRPTVTVKAGGKKLTAGKDYTVTYRNNVRKGTASAVITGIGRYGGTKTVSYHIGEAFASISIPYSSYTYSGSQIKPKVTVKNSSGTVLTEGTHYTLSYSGNIKPGTAKITIVGKGTYGGTRTKTFVVKPAKNEITSISTTKGAFRLKWKSATPGATGYQVLYSTDRNFEKNVHSYTSTVLSDLTENFSRVPESGETWYVKVRSFITKDGKTTSTRYGNYSAVKSIKVV